MKQEEIFEKDDEIRADLVQAASEIGRAELKHRFSKLDGLLAIMVGLLIAGILLLKPSSSEALYAANYTKFKNNLAPITRGGDNFKAEKLAMIDYEQGAYDDALLKLRILGRSNPDAKIYEGIIAMENGDFEKASAILVKVSNDEENRFVKEAGWYLALSYLKLDKKDEAAVVLEGISEGGSLLSEKAKKLLKKL